MRVIDAEAKGDRTATSSSHAKDMQIAWAIFDAVAQAFNSPFPGRPQTGSEAPGMAQLTMQIQTQSA